MPPTPIHGTRAEKDRAHMFVCWDEDGGPGWELRQKVDKLRMQQTAITAIAVFLNSIGLVVLAWWLSTRLPAPPAPRASEPTSLIKTAHAETKGSP